MIYLNGYPFLDSKEDHTFGVPVSQVMASHVACLASNDMTLKQIERIMAENQYQGYPIVEDMTTKTLVGYIGRTELKYAIDRAKRDQLAPQHAKCTFLPATSQSRNSSTPNVSFDTMPATSSQLHVDLSRYMDPTPLTVHPRLPLETVMELFKKMGPRVILIEYRGRLTGLVTVKDCLKYQVKAETMEHGSSVAGTNGDDVWMERVFGILKGAAGWVDGKIGWIGSKIGLRGVLGSGGEVRLRSPVQGRVERSVFAVGGEEEEDENSREGEEDGEVELVDRGRGGR